MEERQHHHHSLGGEFNGTAAALAAYRSYHGDL